MITTTRETANMNNTQLASSHSLRQRGKRSGSFVLTGGRFCTGSFPLPSAERPSEADGAGSTRRSDLAAKCELD
jgi:hypothetical protein